MGRRVHAVVRPPPARGAYLIWLRVLFKLHDLNLFHAQNPRLSQTVHPVHQIPLSRENDRVGEVGLVDALRVRGHGPACRLLAVRWEPANFVEVGDARERHGLNR